MSSFGRWFKTPRKRSNSTPTRQVLSEFLNRSATESFLPPAPQHQLYSYHHVSSASAAAAATGYSSLPTTATSANPSNTFSTAQSAPLLITSSFYDLAYPFEPCDSPEDETCPEVVITRGGGAEDMFSNSRPPTPSSTTTTDVKPQQNHELNSNHKNKQQQQQQMIHNMQPAPPSPQQPLPNAAHYYQRDYEQDDTYYPRETSQPLTWHSKSSPKKIPFNKKGGHSSIKRRATPFADQKSAYHHSYGDDDDDDNEEVDKDDLVFEKTQYEGTKDSSTSAAMDDHQISYTTLPGKTFNSDAYDADVRKLRSEIKRMEKKHKEHEKHILDAQQQLEYLIISRSYDSSFLSGSSAPQYPHNEQWEPPPSSDRDAHHDYSQSFNEQHYRPGYWYPTYDSDYYYSMHTPNNSYSTNTASFRRVSSSSKSTEPYDYAHVVPQKSNEKISHRFDMSDNNNHYSYGYRPSSYASSNTLDDDSYYYQLQQRQHQLLSYGRYHGYTPSRESKKRWTQ